MGEIIQDVTFTVVAFGAVLFNIVEIILIVKIKNRKNFDRLLLSLAVSDALIGIVCLGFNLCKFARASLLEWLSMDITGRILGLSVVFSIANLLAISVDRLIAVKYPIKHRVILTSKRVDISIILLWVLTLIFVVYSGFVAVKRPKELKRLVSITQGSVIFQGLLITMIYFHIFYLVCKRRLFTTAATGKESTTRKRGLTVFVQGPYRSQRAVLFTGCIVTVSFIICTYPRAFDFLVRQPERVSFAPALMLLLNSVINPFVYFFKSYFSSRRALSTSTADMQLSSTKL